jgi:hypothetical protein
MKPWLLPFCLAACPVLAQAQEQTKSLEGRWQLDIARSSSPYSSDVKSGTLTVSIDDGLTFKSEEKITNSDGTTKTYAMHLPVDGRFHPITGVRDAQSAAVTHREAGRITIEMKAAGDLRATESCELAPSHRDTLICTEMDTHARGRLTFGRAVYTRK